MTFEPYLRIDALAAAVGVGEAAIRRAIKSGRLRHVRPGRRIMIRVSDWYRYLDKIATGGVAHTHDASTGATDAEFDAMCEADLRKLNERHRAKVAADAASVAEAEAEAERMVRELRRECRRGAPPATPRKRS